MFVQLEGFFQFPFHIFVGAAVFAEGVDDDIRDFHHLDGIAMPGVPDPAFFTLRGVQSEYRVFSEQGGDFFSQLGNLRLAVVGVDNQNLHLLISLWGNLLRLFYQIKTGNSTRTETGNIVRYPAAESQEFEEIVVVFGEGSCIMIKEVII
jgi:hypothetical protein